MTENFQMPLNEAMVGRVLPPDGLWNRWRHYKNRYGISHAFCSYVGRYFYAFWKVVGRYVTRPYLNRWFKEPGPRIVNLGGGSVLHERWLTADVDPRSDIWTDISRPLPFPDGSLDGVYLEEVIEHVPRPVGKKLLMEVLRVLKPGGRVRITTPSLDYFMRLTADTPQSTEAINDIFYLHGHRHIYSNSELESLLAEVGFGVVLPSSFRDSGSEFGCYDTHPYRFPEAPPECSQYWDAQKRG